MACPKRKRLFGLLGRAHRFDVTNVSAVLPLDWVKLTFTCRDCGGSMKEPMLKLEAIERGYIPAPQDDRGEGRTQGHG